MEKAVLFCLMFSCEIFFASSLCEINVDISDGVRNKDGSVSHGNVLYVRDHVFEDGGKLKGCVCEYKACIYKCCAHGNYYKNGTNNPCLVGQKNVNILIHNGVDVLEEETYHLVQVPPKWCNGIKYLLVNEDARDEWKVQKSGHILLPNDGNVSLDALSFCIEHVEEQAETVVVCASADDIESEEESAVHYLGTICGIQNLILSYLIRYLKKI